MNLISHSEVDYLGELRKNITLNDKNTLSNMDHFHYKEMFSILIDKIPDYDSIILIALAVFIVFASPIAAKDSITSMHFCIFNCTVFCSSGFDCSPVDCGFEQDKKNKTGITIAVCTTENFMI